MKHRILVLPLLSLTLALTASAQPTAFTYQGRLDDGANPANGVYDLQFRLHDALSGGTPSSIPLTLTTVPVSNGLFSVRLDFGPMVFNGGARWLEIGVCTNGSAAGFTVLSPRQPVLSAPYAVRALEAGNAGVVTGPVAASQLAGTIAAANIGDGTITMSMLGAGSVTAEKLADAAVSLPKLQTTYAEPLLQRTYLQPSPNEYDEFGNALAAVGNDRVLIGAWLEDTGASSAGVAYLFSTDGSLIHTFTNPAPAAGDEFGSAVAAVGSDKVLIGAWRDDAGTNNDVGAAYLFSTDGTLLTTFTNPTPAKSDSFGAPLTAVGSDRVLIAAHMDDTGAMNAGAAYLFDLQGNLLRTFTNPAPSFGASFGFAMAAVGSDKVLITGGREVYLFDVGGALLQTYTNPVPQGGYFGYSLAAVGTNNILIGTEKSDTARLFDLQGHLLTTYTNPVPTPAIHEGFGNAVAAVGSEAVFIGCWRDDTLGLEDVGSAYLFDLQGNLLASIANPTPATTDFFGSSLAVLGNSQVVIGANWDDAGATDAGAAHLFELKKFVPGLFGDGVVQGSVLRESLADGAVTPDKISGPLRPDQIPDLDAAKITTGTLPGPRLAGNYGNAVSFPNAGNSFAGTFSGTGSGLTGLSGSALASGTVADARLSSNVALRGGGNTFSGNQILASGNVGLGTVSPESTLDVRGVTTFQPGASGNHDNLVLKKTGSLSGSNVRFVLSHRTEGSRAYLYSHDGSIYRNLQGWDHAANAVRFPATGDTLYVDEGNARIGVGNASPQQRLHVTGNTRIEGSGTGTANPALYITNTSSSGIGIFTTVDSSDANLVVVNKSTGDIFRGFSGTNGGDLVFQVKNSGYVHCADELSCKSLDIRGGADLAEPFAMSETSIPPGAVVVIDEDHPGQLKLSTRAYDSTVAGVVSGAGGVAPGIRMNQQSLLPSGRDVALSGRVYAWVDASSAPVRPGDLLTTSDRPGHAMKALDRARIPGAILGKAMSPLDAGRGLVLVLVSLQ